MAKNSRIKIYKTYRFRIKDPIIDKVRTATQEEARAQGVDERVILNRACRNSGVSPSTRRTLTEPSGSVRQ